MSIADKVPSVNYHLWRYCNMQCGFCFAPFQDISPDVLPNGHLGRADSLSVVESLAQAGFRKINFAGGEPMLCRWLPELIVRASELGLTTSMVTNGSRLTQEWVDRVRGCLDWVALSIDSVNPDTLVRTGRTTGSEPMSAHDYLSAIEILKRSDIRLKVNTVVTRFNLREDLTDFIIEARPERWKLLQVLAVNGQNDHAVGEYMVSDDEFDSYIQFARGVQKYGITVVPESNDLMTGSYIMVDPAGRFFDNVAGTHTYSRHSIIEVGVDEALKDVSIDAAKFLSRNGLYDW